MSDPSIVYAGFEKSAWPDVSFSPPRGARSPWPGYEPKPLSDLKPLPPPVRLLVQVTADGVCVLPVMQDGSLGGVTALNVTRSLSSCILGAKDAWLLVQDRIFGTGDYYEVVWVVSQSMNTATTTAELRKASSETILAFFSGRPEPEPLPEEQET